MSLPVFISVEERLRVTVLYLETFRGLAWLAQEPAPVLAVSSPLWFARVVADLATRTIEQVHVVQSSLPPEGLRIDTPALGGGLMNPIPDSTRRCRRYARAAMQAFLSNPGITRGPAPHEEEAAAVWRGVWAGVAASAFEVADAMLAAEDEQGGAR